MTQEERVRLASRVRVRLMGVFRMLSGKSWVSVTLEEGATIRDVVKKLVESLPPEFGEALVDPALHEPWSNAMIIVSGKEIGVLDGVETAVGDGDEVVLVPATHGG